MGKTILIMQFCFLVLVSCNRFKTLKADKEKIGDTAIHPYFIDIEKNLNNVKSVPLSSIGKELIPSLYLNNNG